VLNTDPYVVTDPGIVPTSHDVISAAIAHSLRAPFGLPDLDLGGSRSSTSGDFAR